MACLRFWRRIKHTKARIAKARSYVIIQTARTRKLASTIRRATPRSLTDRCIKIQSYESCKSCKSCESIGLFGNETTLSSPRIKFRSLSWLIRKCSKKIINWCIKTCCISLTATDKFIRSSVKLIRTWIKILRIDDFRRIVIDGLIKLISNLININFF